MSSVGAMSVYSEALSVLLMNGGLDPDAVPGNLLCRTLDVESAGSFIATPVYVNSIPKRLLHVAPCAPALLSPLTEHSFKGKLLRRKLKDTLCARSARR